MPAQLCLHTCRAHPGEYRLESVVAALKTLALSDLPRIALSLPGATKEFLSKVCYQLRAVLTDWAVAPSENWDGIELVRL